MINIDDVMVVLSTLSSKSVEDLQAFLPIINSAISATSRLVAEDSHSDDRAIYLAAAKANYDISLINQVDDVSSFRAGDVSITTSNSDRHKASKEILDNAMKNASDIVSDNGFAFMGV